MNAAAALMIDTMNRLRAQVGQFRAERVGAQKEWTEFSTYATRLAACSADWVAMCDRELQLYDTIEAALRAGATPQTAAVVPPQLATS